MKVYYNDETGLIEDHRYTDTRMWEPDVLLDKFYALNEYHEAESKKHGSKSSAPVKLMVILFNADGELISSDCYGFNSKKAAQLADRDLRENLGEDQVVSRIIFD